MMLVSGSHKLPQLLVLLSKYKPEMIYVVQEALTPALYDTATGHDATRFVQLN